jgi:hypothetical protein
MTTPQEARSCASNLLDDYSTHVRLGLVMPTMKAAAAMLTEYAALLERLAQPVDERAAFEARFEGCVKDPQDDDYSSEGCQFGWEAWQARAALNKP